MYDTVDARRCEDGGKVLKAYERRVVSGAKLEDDQYRADMALGAKLLESLGDFLGQGFAKRTRCLMLR